LQSIAGNCRSSALHFSVPWVSMAESTINPLFPNY
jgi:hypothetical protein